MEGLKAGQALRVRWLGAFTGDGVGEEGLDSDAVGAVRWNRRERVKEGARVGPVG